MLQKSANKDCQEKLNLLKEEALKILEELPQLIMLNGQVVLDLSPEASPYESKNLTIKERLNDSLKIKHVTYNNFNFQLLKNELVILRRDLKAIRAHLSFRAQTFTRNINAHIGFSINNLTSPQIQHSWGALVNNKRNQSSNQVLMIL